jgi:hypothetical protein
MLTLEGLEMLNNANIEVGLAYIGALVVTGALMLLIG